MKNLQKLVLVGLVLILFVSGNAQTTATIKLMTVKELTEMKLEMLNSFFVLDKPEEKKATAILTERYTALKSAMDTTKTEIENQEKFSVITIENSKKLKNEIIAPAIISTVNKKVKSLNSVITLTPETENQLLNHLKPVYENAGMIFFSTDKLGGMVVDEKMSEEYITFAKKHLIVIFKENLSPQIEAKSKIEAEPFIKQLQLPEEQHQALVSIISEKIKGNIENCFIYSDKSEEKEANNELNDKLKQSIYEEFLTDEYVAIQVNRVVSIFSLSKQKEDTLSLIFSDQLAEMRANKSQFGSNKEVLAEKNRESKRKSIARMDKTILNDVVESSTKNLIDLINVFAKLDDKTKDKATILTSDYFKTVKTIYLENGEQSELFKSQFLDASSQFAIKICTDILLEIVQNMAIEKSKKYIKLLGLSDEQSTKISIILVDQLKWTLINTIAYYSDKDLRKKKNDIQLNLTKFRMKTEVLTESQRKKLNMIGL